jgi:hypothetical protein
MYVAAMVDLWRYQQSKNMNGNSCPRDIHVKNFLGNLKSQEAQQKRQNCIDRQIGGINDGYTTITEMIKLFEFFWIQKNYHGAGFQIV